MLVFASFYIAGETGSRLFICREGGKSFIYLFIKYTTLQILVLFKIPNPNYEL